MCSDWASDEAGASIGESDPPGWSDDADPDGPGDASSVRNWVVIATVFAGLSLATAAGIASLEGVGSAVLGSVLLALGFAAFAILPSAGRSDVLAALGESWAEHRLYTWFATGLFGFGIALGAALYLVAGVDLVELIGEILLGEFDDDQLDATGGGLDLTATFFITNNTPPFLAAIFGWLTLGALTALIMVLNGFIVGNLAIVVGMEIGFGVIVVLIAPHAVFEFAALFVAAGIGFRFLHRAVQRVTGSRAVLFTRGYLVRTGLLILFAWLVLVLAAFVEAYLTIPIAEFLFGGQLE